MYPARTHLSRRRGASGDFRPQQARRKIGTTSPDALLLLRSMRGLTGFFYLRIGTLALRAFRSLGAWNPEIALSYWFSPCLLIAGKQSSEIPRVYVEPVVMGHGSCCDYGYCSGEWRGKWDVMQSFWLELSRSRGSSDLRSSRR